MNARPHPMAETQKGALLEWLRARYSYGQGAPSDRDIARRFGLRSTDDALALVNALQQDGDITIQLSGNTRSVLLRDPPPLAGARPLTTEMIEAAKAAVPLPPPEPAPVRGKPAPVAIRPTRPLFTPIVVDPAPIPPRLAPPVAPSAVMPAVVALKEENMPVVSPPTSPAPSIERPRAATRHTVHIKPLKDDFEALAARAVTDRKPISTYALDIILAHLAERSDTASAKPVPIAGKPRLSARVLRIANADERGFWAAINMMIELGATALAAHQEDRA